MLIQKIFHIHRSVAETRRQLANVNSYWRELGGVNKAMITADGIGQFEFKTLSGHTITAAVAEVEDSSSPDRVLFRSVGGNVQVAGSVEFFAIRPNITEVALTLEYELDSPFHRVMDRVTAGIDRFLNRQLLRIQMHFDGLHPADDETPARNSASAAAPRMTAQFA